MRAMASLCALGSTTGSRFRYSRYADGAPWVAAMQKLSPSCSHKFPNVASQIRVAFLRIVSNTRSSSPDELEITPSTSVAAANCTIASSRSRSKCAAFASSLAAEELRRGAARALRRFGVAAFRRRDLTDAEPALERRRIAHPKTQDYADFQGGITSRDLQLAKWGAQIRNPLLSP